jgi:2-iminobutanoate/2-iminopropanoate deaminase
MKQVLNPDGLPRPGGTYSLVVRAGGSVFVAGLLGMDPERRLAGDDIGSQTRQALENLRVALAGAGATLADVCSVTVFLADVDRDFAAFNAVYGEYFAVDPPARATVGVRIPGGALVEVQAIAVTD